LNFASVDLNFVPNVAERNVGLPFPYILGEILVNYDNSELNKA
jgi:hypothetical protein